MHSCLDFCLIPVIDIRGQAEEEHVEGIPGGHGSLHKPMERGCVWKLEKNVENTPREYS